MTETPPRPMLTREERLAAQLRANLRRRKAQARLMTGAPADGQADRTDGVRGADRPDNQD